MIQYVTIGISICALVAAWVGAIMAFRSSNIAKRSLKIVEEQAKGRCPLLVPYLMKSSFFMAENNSKRIYTFLVSLTNRSDLDNSIVNMQLQLNYHRLDEHGASLILSHSTELRTYLGKDVQNVLSNPLKIPSHDTIAGLILFECSSKVLEEIIIDSYDIIFVDSNGLQSKLEPIYLTEIISGTN